MSDSRNPNLGALSVSAKILKNLFTVTKPVEMKDFKCPNRHALSEALRSNKIHSLHAGLVNATNNLLEQEGHPLHPKALKSIKALLPYKTSLNHLCPDTQINATKHEGEIALAFKEAGGPAGKAGFYLHMGKSFFEKAALLINPHEDYTSAHMFVRKYK